MAILGSMWKQEDPRDNLQKAGRYELAQLAKRLGFNDITYDTPQPLQVKMLRERGVTNIDIPDRVLGDTRPTVYNVEPVAQSTSAPVPAENRTLNADELLEMQYKANQKPSAIKSIDQMSMTELRSACKVKGIKMARTDNLNTLREKLRG